MVFEYIFFPSADETIGDGNELIEQVRKLF